MINISWLQQQFPDLSSFVALPPTGQKSVFLASHKTDGDVVLKVFLRGADRERIIREIDAPLKIKSPRVPQILDKGSLASPSGNIIWLRERRIAGSNLKDTLSAHGKRSVDAAMRIALHVLEVLEAAEIAGVVHRDIKPGNIIIAPDGSAWVIDFGFARHLDLDSVTSSAAAFAPCTPGYAPVEQFTNQKTDVDGRADLFATGVTIYECLHGENPFVKGTKGPLEALDRIKKTALPRISATGCPSEFVDLIDAMTRGKLDHRAPNVAYASKWMRELAAAHNIV